MALSAFDIDARLRSGSKAKTTLDARRGAHSTPFLQILAVSTDGSEYVPSLFQDAREILSYKLSGNNHVGTIDHML